MVYRVGLQPIQFKQPSVYRHIADEMKRLVVSAGGGDQSQRLLLFNTSWLRVGVRVVNLGDLGHVAYGIAFALRVNKNKV